MTEGPGDVAFGLALLLATLLAVGPLAWLAAGMEGPGSAASGVPGPFCDPSWLQFWDRATLHWWGAC